MENEKLLLDMFVCHDGIRMNIHEPFRQDDRICATDGRMMIRIDEKLCENGYTETPSGLKAPNTNSVVPKPNMCETIPAWKLNRALANAPEERDRRCPECNGEGCVEYEYRDRHGKKHTTDGDCPECEGTGEVNEYTDIKYQFTLHGHALAYKHLKMLLRTMAYLNTNSLRLRHMQTFPNNGDTQILLFDVEDKDIEILAMPQLRDEKLKEIKI